MFAIEISAIGKAFRYYPNKISRLLEWFDPTDKKRHTSKWILRNISFRVGVGEAVGIVGINGAGKSTLLKIICGTLLATEGTISINGRVAAMLELGMGFHPEFTGRENVYLAGQLLGLSRDELDNLLPAIQNFAEIGEYFDQPIRIYSSGMSVRLAFAVATAKRPEVLIVDEALSVGDAYFQQKSFKRIREFQESGTTLLLVSHDIAAVRAICDRAVWLSEGTIKAQGSTVDVLDAYSAALYGKQQSVELPIEVGKMTVASFSNDVDVVGEPVLCDVARDIEGGEVRPELEWRRDFRQDLINESTLRNDIRAFDFDWNAKKWGDGTAKISSVSLINQKGEQLSWVLGGESVTIRVEVTALSALTNAIVGFLFRDRLGQPLFGDNSFLHTHTTALQLEKGQSIVMRFSFLLPILPHGTYWISAAIANGTQDVHTICEWVENSVAIESHNRVSVSGMVGIPMHSVSYKIR